MRPEVFMIHKLITIQGGISNGFSVSEAFLEISPHAPIVPVWGRTESDTTEAT